MEGAQRMQAAATTGGAVAQATALPERLGGEPSHVGSVAFGGDFLAMADV